LKVITVGIDQIDALVELFDGYRVWYGKSSDKPAAKNFLSERINRKESIIYICLNQDKQAIGFTQLYPIFSSTRMKRMWLLNDLFVHPDHRGKGVSKLLINQAKELSKQTEACGILLETEKSNNIGNKLYPAMGFHLEGNNFYFWTNP